jgi:hypothetical protein
MSPLLLTAFIVLLHQPGVRDDDNYGAISEIYEWQGKLKYPEETYPNAAASTTESICLDPVPNPCHGGRTHVTNLA